MFSSVGNTSSDDSIEFSVINFRFPRATKRFFPSASAASVFFFHIHYCNAFEIDGPVTHGGDFTFRWITNIISVVGGNAFCSSNGLMLSEHANTRHVLKTQYPLVNYIAYIINIYVMVIILLLIFFFSSSRVLRIILWIVCL